MFCDQYSIAIDSLSLTDKWTIYAMAVASCSSYSADFILSELLKAPLDILNNQSVKNLITHGLMNRYLRVPFGSGLGVGFEVSATTFIQAHRLLARVVKAPFVPKSPLREWENCWYVLARFFYLAESNHKTLPNMKFQAIEMLKTIKPSILVEIASQLDRSDYFTTGCPSLIACIDSDGRETLLQKSLAFLLEYRTKYVPTKELFMFDKLEPMRWAIHVCGELGDLRTVERLSTIANDLDIGRFAIKSMEAIRERYEAQAECAVLG